MQASRELCASFVVAPAAANVVFAVIFQQWQIQSNFAAASAKLLCSLLSEYATLTFLALGGFDNDDDAREFCMISTQTKMGKKWANLSIIEEGRLSHSKPKR